MNGYLLPLSCPRCGAGCDHITSGAPYGLTEASAIARCHDCGREWHIMVRLIAVAHEPSAERQRRHRAKVSA